MRRCAQYLAVASAVPLIVVLAALLGSCGKVDPCAVAPCLCDPGRPECQPTPPPASPSPPAWPEPHCGDLRTSADCWQAPQCCTHGAWSPATWWSRADMCAVNPEACASPSPTPSWPPCEQPPCTCWLPAAGGGYYQIPCPSPSPSESPSPSAPPTPPPSPLCPAPVIRKFAGGGACVGAPIPVEGGLECFLTATQRYDGGPCEPGRDGWLTTCCGREQDDPRGPEWTIESDGCIVSIEDRGNPFNRFVVTKPGCVVRSRVCARVPLMRRVNPCVEDPCDNSTLETVKAPEPNCWETSVQVKR